MKSLYSHFRHMKFFPHLHLTFCYLCITLYSTILK
nr:MAG TPA: hypothetical protein [Bacteriophage sp.]